MVGPDGVDGPDLAFDDQAEEMDEGQLVLGIVDLAAEEGDLCAVLLSVVEQLEGIASGSGRAAEDADDQVGVEPDQLLHGPGAVIDHFEKNGTARGTDARKHPRDHVVDVLGQDFGIDRAGDVGVEHLEEVAKAFSFGLLAKVVKPFEGHDVAVEVVVERHAVQTEVGPPGALFGSAIEVAALDVIETGGAEGSLGALVVASAPSEMDVGRIVGANRRGDGRAIEESFAESQRVV